MTNTSRFLHTASGHAFHPSAGSPQYSTTSSTTSSNNDASCERSFPCPEPGCDRHFHRKFTLREHMKTHTGEKPYQCAIQECAKRFSTSGNLARHNRLHSSKIHTCTVADCERVFTKQEKLMRHLKVHMGSAAYACRSPDCSKTFSTSGNLTRHVRSQHRTCHTETTAPAHSRFAIAMLPPMVKHTSSAFESRSLVRLHNAKSSPRSQQTWQPGATMASHSSDGISDGEILELLQCLFVETPGAVQPSRAYLTPRHQEQQVQQQQRFDPQLMQDFTMSF